MAVKISREEKVAAARKRKAVEQFMAFLMTGLSHGRTDKEPKRGEMERHSIREGLKAVSSGEILTVIAFYRDHPTLFDAVWNYARKFECASNLTPEGIQEAKDLMIVQEVMDL